MSNGGAQFFSHNFRKTDGTPYAGVKIYHYAAGTTTAKDIWSDEGKTTLLAQPHTGDPNGMIWFYADGDYHLKVTDKDDVLLYDWDNIKITSDTATMWEGNEGTAYPPIAAANRWQLFAKHTAGNVIQELGINDGTVFKAIKSFREAAHVLNVKDFGAKGDGIADDTTALQLCFDSAPANSIVYFPAGQYNVTGTTTASTLSTGANVKRIYGDGYQSRIHQVNTTNPGQPMLRVPANIADFSMSHMRLTQISNSVEQSGNAQLHISSGGPAGVVMIDHCYFENWEGDAISIESKKSIVTNNYFSSQNGHAIYGGTDNMIIANNHIRDVSPGGSTVINALKLQGGGPAGGVGQVKVIGNTLDGTTDTTGRVHGIVLLNLTDNSVISGNTIIGMSGFAIQTAGAIKNAIISNNNLIGKAGMTQVMLQLAGGSGHIVSCNFVDASMLGAGAAGIDVKGPTSKNNIYGNTIKGPADGYAITVTGADAMVHHNQIISGSRGIQVNLVGNVKLIDNMFLGLTGAKYDLSGALSGTTMEEFDPRIRSVTFAQANGISLAHLDGDVVEVGALTANLTMAVPSLSLTQIGKRWTFRFVQDATGGRTITWDSAFEHNWSDTGNTASKKSTITFYYNGTKWVQEGAQLGWY
ncbi:hypothetical protein EPN95_04635 [Patescibacteria group bacterium]|nr:MAG: hypothetical protein EPN95_04635 [Patescibacteria group bacterium]